jgi:aromatic-L-amino-acid/L-tryptophan decarboxylase
MAPMDAEEFRKAGYQAIDQSTVPLVGRVTYWVVVEYFQTIGERTVLPSVEPGFMRKALPTEIPEQGVKWDEIQPDIEKIIMVRPPGPLG